MIKCFQHQDYPKDKMEWIILDDGTDKIEDLVKDIPQVKYYKYDTKMVLGKKRNLMHTHASGDIIIYMDDDDYYPPQRVSHAVERLQENPEALCAGSSEIYIYFKHIGMMYQFGPYGPKHATAGTFAFRRQLLETHQYDDKMALAEEKSFLKNYTVPFVQLDPLKTILVFSHEHNTFDKKKLLENPHPDFVRQSTKTVDMFVKESDMHEFYMNEIDRLLPDYKPGRPSMKPDVLQQIIEIESTRRKEAEAMAQRAGEKGQNSIVVQQGNGDHRRLSLDEVVNILQKQQEQIGELTACIEGKNVEIKLLEDTIEDMKVNDEQQNMELVVTEKPEAVAEAETDIIPVTARPDSDVSGLHADNDIIAQINGQN